jgi:hypothetical protein
VAVVEMSLRFAGVRDPNLLQQTVSEMTRESIPEQDASVGTQDMDRQTISGGVPACGGDAPAIMSVVWPALPANMLVERRALRLRDVSSDGLGFMLLPRDYHLAFILGLSLSGWPRVHGLLFLANKRDADEFSEGFVRRLNQNQAGVKRRGCCRRPTWEKTNRRKLSSCATLN